MRRIVSNTFASAVVAALLSSLLGCASHTSANLPPRERAMSTPLAAASSSTASADTRDEIFDGGWAGYERPVTGGAGTTKEQAYVVRTRAELVRALAVGDASRVNLPKIIRITGAIDLNVNAANEPLTEAHYRDPAFSWESYARSFARATWGDRKPEGALEDARMRSARAQQEVVVIPVGSNTTILGVGNGALLKNGGLLLKDVENIIIRNVTFEDAYDFFPAWDPTDNGHGEWNAAYDNITMLNARRIWVDFCTFSDGARPDRFNRSLLGRPMQFHDGLVDIIRQSDLITISNSRFRDHDKGMLIGNSDARKEDAGRLRVTLHNNWFENVKERSPRVRYGQVHLYNNLYSASQASDYGYGYSIGVGVSSQILAESNVFDVAGESNRLIVRTLGGHSLEARDNWWISAGKLQTLDLSQRVAHNPNTPPMATIGWKVPYRFRIVPPIRLAEALRAESGAGTPLAILRSR